MARERRVHILATTWAWIRDCRSVENYTDNWQRFLSSNGATRKRRAFHRRATKYEARETTVSSREWVQPWSKHSNTITRIQSLQGKSPHSAIYVTNNLNAYYIFFSAWQMTIAIWLHFIASIIEHFSLIAARIPALLRNIACTQKYLTPSISIADVCISTSLPWFVWQFCCIQFILIVVVFSLHCWFVVAWCSLLVFGHMHSNAGCVYSSSGSSTIPMLSTLRNFHMFPIAVYDRHRWSITYALMLI